jgi:hypothetical protein
MTGLTREGIVAKACELGFEDVRFTTAQASPRTGLIGELFNRQVHCGGQLFQCTGSKVV